MRLIDADTLIDYFYYGIDDKPIIDGISDRKIIDIIKNQPTTYDIDKVVEELEKLADENYKSYCIGFNSDDRAEYDAYTNAIEIVKQVGVGTETETIRDKAVRWNNNSSKRVPYEFIDYVEGKREISVSDDVCKWKQHEKEIDVYFTECGQAHIFVDGNPEENNHVFCPYCGKKIKVVE